MELPIPGIAGIIHAEIKGNPGNVFSRLLIDSRTSGLAEKGLFVCINGERHNGHAYIRELYEQGCRCFLVSEVHEYYDELKNAAFLVVNDTVVALQQLASYKRSCFNIPVVGITGSNGKTIVKEWLWQLLAPDYHICKN